MTQKIKVYQWPNILAIDAAMIAPLWLAALAKALNIEIEWPAYTVLLLSVWLTYTADRLFDVRSRPLTSLQSLRHQYTKLHQQPIWMAWFLVLLLNLGAATQLHQEQLEKGFILLAICLLYTFLNQKLSRRFFPKELCVATIYAGGVVVFIPQSIPISFLISFAWLCLVNCLVIGSREKEIDDKMRVHSIAPHVAEPYMVPAILASAFIIVFLKPPGCVYIVGCLAALIGLRRIRNRTPVEEFRVLADSTLLIGAMLALI